MKRLSHNELRDSFSQYFAERGHTIVPSHSLIPPADPTLLFVNAGMVQFKDIFTGQQQVEYPRAGSIQKCLRVSGKHNDLETVGLSERHQTFFEMLGNFSFGDYFKKDAIHFGWDYLVNVLGLPADRLWVTIHPDDADSERIWLQEIGFPGERLQKFETNFWSMGDTGPCGPCSEIHIDTKPDKRIDMQTICVETDPRFLELWNLVFMQYERHSDGRQTNLPKPSVDTGMGFERILSILQGVDSNYKTDAFAPIFSETAAILGRQPQNEAERVAFKVIADHGRATTFLIADGVYPENVGRGYVLRRIMRRAIRFGYKLGLEDPFLHRICARVIETMGQAYPALSEQRELIDRLVLQEELRFGKTLFEGMKKLEAGIDAARLAKSDALDGELAFKLHDTYGFPIDLTQLITREHDIGVDIEVVNQLMAEQKQRGRESWKENRAETNPALASLPVDQRKTRFLGYDDVAGTGSVLLIVSGEDAIERAEPGSDVQVVLDQTPFYAESGGQIGDTGLFLNAAGETVMVVRNTQKLDGTFLHIGRVADVALTCGMELQLQVDSERRRSIEKNHSATHLLHFALRKHLGTHVKQRGSLVAPDRLRFDFSHFSAVTTDELLAIEQLVNGKVRDNDPVVIEEMPIQQALDRGAMAFFGEKYGSEVRVVQISGDSIELCGGTHVDNAGEIGLFKIVSEGSIASGVRRIEAYTAKGAAEFVQQQLDVLEQACAVMQSQPENLVNRLEKLIAQNRELQTEVNRLKTERSLQDLDGFLQQVQEFDGVRALAVRIDDTEQRTLRDLGDRLRDKLESGILLLIGTAAEKVFLVLMVTTDLSKRFHAGKLIKTLAETVGGRGGGRPEMAQAGGPDVSKADAVIPRFYELLGG